VSEADAVAVVLFVGVTMYAVFGGADFGAGLWSLFAGGGERGRRPRQLQGPKAVLMVDEVPPSGVSAR